MASPNTIKIQKERKKLAAKLVPRMLYRSVEIRGKHRVTWPPLNLGIKKFKRHHGKGGSGELARMYKDHVWGEVRKPRSNKIVKR